MLIMVVLSNGEGPPPIRSPQRPSASCQTYDSRPVEGDPTGTGLTTPAYSDTVSWNILKQSHFFFLYYCLALESSNNVIQYNIIQSPASC